MSVWWALGLGIFDLVAFVAFVCVMVFAFKRVAKALGPWLGMLMQSKPPPQ